ncbi:MAG: DNA-3-methyladenine glycosylase [Thermomicrobiales bacterium]
MTRLKDPGQPGSSSAPALATRPRLPRAFYDRPALTVAREALGMVLVRREPAGLQAGRIVEVEAYDGPGDAASHARSGVTGRARIMFGPPGYAYVYLIYGIHHCLNFVTGPVGYPAAILLRGLEPLARITERTNGPGLICRALAIDRCLNGADLTGDELWLEDWGRPVADVDLVARPRVGIKFAGEPSVSRLWRLYERNNRWVSKR